MKIPFFGKRTEAAAPITRAALADVPNTPPKRRWMGRMLSGMFKSSVVNPNDQWTAIPLPPDQFITLRQPALVARSREQWSNNDYVRGYVRRCRQNIVGEHGVKLQAKPMRANGKIDKNAAQAIEDAWTEWGELGNCDVTGTMTWRELQALAIEHASRDGEFIFRKVRGADAGPFGFALQLLDPQRLQVRYEANAFGIAGNFIRNGIEFNRYGRPVAYHFASTDEMDAYFYYSMAGKGFVRVPADEIIHGFVKEMASQRRGIPWTATGLFRMHHLQGFEDAAVQNARASASKMGFIKYEDGFGPEADDDTNVADTINAEPLSFHELPAGASIQPWDPQYPSGEFAVFQKSMLRGASTGWGVAYNSLANDLEGVNFSSIRDGKVDERDNWKELQGWLISVLCKPVFNEWLKIALLSEKITDTKGKPLPATKLATFKKVIWQGRRWAWIDPKSDATAKVTEIRAGLTSPSQVIREQARDPEKVFAEIAQDIEDMKAAGIPETIVNIIFGVAPAPEPAPSKGDVSQGKEPKE
jgi:lambda family phage portal protein